MVAAVQEDDAAGGWSQRQIRHSDTLRDYTRALQGLHPHDAKGRGSNQRVINQKREER